MGSPSRDIASHLRCAAASLATQTQLSQHALIFCEQPDHDKLQSDDHEPPRSFQHANARIPLRLASSKCVRRPLLLHANKRLHLRRRVVVLVMDIPVLVLRLHHDNRRNE